MNNTTINKEEIKATYIEAVTKVADYKITMGVQYTFREFVPEEKEIFDLICIHKNETIQLETEEIKKECRMYNETIKDKKGKIYKFVLPNAASQNFESKMFRILDTTKVIAFKKIINKSALFTFQNRFEKEMLNYVNKKNPCPLRQGKVKNKIKLKN